MPDDLFAHAWARFDRAVELATEMVQMWNAYISGHPYSIDLLDEGGGVFILRVLEDEQPPEKFAVVTGEWANHLRAALDYTLWAAAAHQSGKVPPPDQGRIQYPIYDSRDAWDRNLRGLRSLGEHQRSMLLAMQPFNGDPDANFLRWINRIARSDRHRHLSRMTGYLAEVNPALRFPEGTSATLQWGERVISSGYADVARFTLTPWTSGTTPDGNPRMGIDPEIEEWSESTFWRRFPFSQRLRLMQLFVATELAIYEYDSTGYSRRQDALTDAFRAESDERRTDAVRYPRRTRKSVQWSPPIPARQSTPGELAGDNFPPSGPGPIRPRHSSLQVVTKPPDGP